LDRLVHQEVHLARALTFRTPTNPEKSTPRRRRETGSHRPRRRF
jgi:curved DNA-binding protein CbpA